MNDVDVQSHKIQEYGTLLTPQTLEHLAAALHVQWPTWYKSLMFPLLKVAKTFGDWLPGGFLYSRPALIYRDTIDYQDRNLSLLTTIAHDQHSLQPIDWPQSFVVVGHCGDGAIFINTSADDHIFNNIYKEDYTIRQFIDIRNVAATPEHFAEMLIAHEADK